MSNKKGVKDRKLQSATFKHIAFPEYELFENEEQKQFAQTYTKQSTIDKVNALQFQNDTDNCRGLVDCLLKEYDFWHPYTQTTLCQSGIQADKEGRSNSELKENCMDGIKECENEDNVNETESSNIKLKSNIIFLELENKKLQLKQKLLQKKYQKQVLEVKMAPNMEMMLRKREKQLLEIQLNLLKQIKLLSQKLQSFNRPFNNSIIIDIKSNSSKQHLKETQNSPIKKKKKLNKAKLLNYLIQKVDTIDSKDEFLQLLDKTQASLFG